MAFFRTKKHTVESVLTGVYFSRLIVMYEGHYCPGARYDLSSVPTNIALVLPGAIAGVHRLIKRPNKYKYMLCGNCWLLTLNIRVNNNLVVIFMWTFKLIFTLSRIRHLMYSKLNEQTRVRTLIDWSQNNLDVEKSPKLGENLVPKITTKWIIKICYHCA